MLRPLRLNPTRRNPANIKDILQAVNRLTKSKFDAVFVSDAYGSIINAELVAGPDEIHTGYDLFIANTTKAVLAFRQGDDIEVDFQISTDVEKSAATIFEVLLVLMEFAKARRIETMAKLRLNRLLDKNKQELG
jgi:hypothetical protein